MLPLLRRVRAALLFACLTLPARDAFAAVPIPLKSAVPVPLNRVRVSNPAVLPLAGTWRFRLVHGLIGPSGFVERSDGPATASSAQDGRPPTDALDGLRLGTAWCAEDGRFPQWWRVDLGKPEALRALSIAWEFPDALYRFKVDGSLEGRDWFPIANRSAMPGVHDGSVAISPATLRFLRVTVVGADRPGKDAWACIRRVGITVRQNGADIEWKPVLPHPDTGSRNAFARESETDRAWSDVPVPSNWEMQGFSRPTYDNPDDAVGLYRRWIDVPASFAGKQVLWHFDGVWDGAELFVNGRPAGYHESGFTAFDMDVTPLLRPGQRNLLALRVSKRTPSVDLDTGDYWSLGGIYRETYLLALPATHVTDMTVVTDLDDRYRDATLGTAINISGRQGAAVSVRGNLFRASGDRVPGVEIRGRTILGKNGNGAIQVNTPVPAPNLWSAEKPNLYYAVMTLSDGSKSVEHFQERFGFRTVKIEGGVVLWNGVPIKCAGSCRHEEWAAYGHALTEHCWRTDLNLMKGCNINAIRTSHYNHAQRFLELCDEMGIYVLDEVPACWCDVNAPDLKAAFVQRTRETLQRDKNRPCVLAWSLSNESGYGPNVLAMFDYAKANDPTRPAFISQCGPWNNPRLDFHDTHYPSYDEVKRMAAEPLRQTTPLVMTEQPHIFYVNDGLAYDYGEKDLWGQVLARNWSVVWPTDSILGSFIWEWQDQGIADKFPDRQGVDAEGLRDNNHKGVVDGYRHPKPEYWNIKMVYSPITTAARETALTTSSHSSLCSVPIQNRYSFTNLSELICRWQELSRGKVLAHGEQRVACPPRSSTDATFPATTGMDTLRIEFIHLDGQSVYTARLRVKGSEPPAPPTPMKSSGSIRLDDRAGEIAIDAGSSHLVIAKNGAAMMSWAVDGQTLITGGPILNLGEGRANHGDHDARNFVESLSDPVLKQVTVNSRREGNCARVTVTGEVYLQESPDPKGKLTYVLEIQPDAQIRVTWALDWQAPDANAWELGMKLTMPPSMNRIQWSRDGLWTDYPKDHIGANEGTAERKELSFRCTKRDARWMTAYGVGGAALTAIRTDTPLHVRARADRDRTVLFLSSAVSVPYDFSTWLAPDLLIHLQKGHTVSGSFVLRSTPRGLNQRLTRAQSAPFFGDRVRD